MGSRLFLSVTLQHTTHMKNCSLLLLAMLFACHSGGTAEPQIGDDVKILTDIRYLNNFPLDLTPLRRWFRGNKEGVRPLSAWKRFDLIQIKEDYVGKKVCMVKNEAGDFEEILINNFPSEMKTYMDRINSLKAQVASMKAEIDELEPRIRAQNAVTSVAAGGDRDYVEERMEQRASVNLAAANLITKKENLARAQAALASNIAAAPHAGELFLVKYGGTWGKYTVWEHGQRSR